MSNPVFGCTTVTFGGTLPEKLSAMRAAGFQATELWPRDVFEHAEGPEVAMRALEETGLSVSVYQALRDYEGMDTDARTTKLNIASQMMDQMDLIGADTLVLCSNCAVNSSGDMDRLKDDLRRLADLAGGRGKRISYEVLAWGRHVKDYRQGADLVAELDHPHFGLMLDCFHLFAVETPVSFLSELDMAKVFHVEIADFPKSRLPIIDVSRNYRLFPGQGAYDAEGFARDVLACGYDGILTVEVFNAVYRTQPPDSVAELAMESLRTALSKH